MYSIRPFNPTDEEYQAIVDVHNADWPETPATPSTWQHEDGTRDKRYLFLRYVVEADGQIVAEGCYGENDWAHVPGKYFVAFSMHPAHQNGSIQHAIFEYAVERLKTLEPKPTAILGDSREDRTVRTEFLLNNGFKQIMRYSRSKLDITQFDASRFDGLAQRIEQEGLDIMSIADYQSLDSDWQRKYWEARTEILLDVPSSDPITPAPLEEDIKMYAHPHFRADAHFVAVNKHDAADSATWEIVGVSQIAIDPDLNDKVNTWLTGVRRAYRRKGLATALKLRAINFVQNLGARYIETDNEENNPMYGINVTLGFEPQPAWLEFEKELPK